MDEKMVLHVLMERKLYIGGMAARAHEGPETEYMSSYCSLNRDSWAETVFPGNLASRYAWLEREKGKWHFLTNLFADVGEATRSWPTAQCALDELACEGWAVVGSYPENAETSHPSDEAAGYGLIWTGR